MEREQKRSISLRPQAQPHVWDEEQTQPLEMDWQIYMESRPLSIPQDQLQLARHEDRPRGTITQGSGRVDGVPHLLEPYTYTQI